MKTDNQKKSFSGEEKWKEEKKLITRQNKAEKGNCPCRSHNSSHLVFWGKKKLELLYYKLSYTTSGCHGDSSLNAT